MNLLPADAPRPRRLAAGAGFPRRARRGGGMLFAGLTLAVIGLDARSLGTRLEEARSERERLRTLVAEQEHREERLRDDRERLRQLRVTEGRLVRWNEERSLLPELLGGLSAAIPDVAVLESVRRAGPDLRVTGRAGSAAAVTRTLEALSALERVDQLELLWVEQADTTTEAAEQRFAFAGSLRYRSPEPGPFERVEAASGKGPTGR